MLPGKFNPPDGVGAVPGWSTAPGGSAAEPEIEMAPQVPEHHPFDATVQSQHFVKVPVCFLFPTFKEQAWLTERVQKA